MWLYYARYYYYFYYYFAQVWAAYSPVKNSPADAAAKAAGGNPSHSATSGELDIYRTNCAALRMAGATVEGPEPREFNGLTLDLWPRVSWSPFFALTFSDLQVIPWPVPYLFFLCELLCIAGKGSEKDK